MKVRLFDDSDNNRQRQMLASQVRGFVPNDSVPLVWPAAISTVTFLLDAGILDEAERNIEWLKARVSTGSYAPIATVSTPPTPIVATLQTLSGVLHLDRKHPDRALAT